jgi:23S rRNA (adenine2030-N6)-methyltransferase
MNYHHIYHAGNFADIFKHIVLTLCLEKMHEKPNAFFALDTHAGIGRYDLLDEKSLKTSEFIGEKNFKKIRPFLPERYIKILAKTNRVEITEIPEMLKVYAGSPAIIRDYLRRDDRAIFAELNRDDYSQLRKNFAGSEKFTMLNEDGFALLKSKLPPLEKRGIILMDPAFEKDQSKVSADYKKIVDSLEDAYKRFAHGIYLIWYPIIKSDAETLKNFYEEIAKLKFEKKLHATFDVGSRENDSRMHACGMFIFNAPWQLEEKLNDIMPKILEVLQVGKNPSFSLKHLS